MALTPWSDPEVVSAARSEDLNARELVLQQRLNRVREGRAAEEGDAAHRGGESFEKRDYSRWIEEAVLVELAKVREQRAHASKSAWGSEASGTEPETDQGSPARLRAEGEIREAILREVIDLVPVGVVVHSVEGKAPLANARAGALAGRISGVERTLLHQDGRRFTGPELPLNRALRGETVFEEDAQVASRDGRTTPLRLAARPVRDSQGRITHVVETFQDLTVNPGLNEFLAELSHELRTPMTSILGWTRLLSEGDLPAEKQAHGLAVIERNAQLQMHLIEDLLDASLMLAGRLRLTPRPTLPREVVDRVMDSIQFLASRKGISLSARVGDECGEVMLDPDRLQQLVWNLLANALKLTVRGGTVSLTVSQSGGRLRLLVRDSGEELDPSVVPAMLQRFSPLDGTHGRHLGGLGLGLGR